ncbi:MAG: peptidoglycan DD-metalloendopeptidase family protein [Candidatus Daviesbacteria bacterium]|nr:peptidoglycan DD-metalloendopeptidase family protein [Candidatus Daviesbacteria bacterium]
MAQFLMSRFLSQALEWKDRFPAAKVYAGLKFEPFIYTKARLTFPDYSRLYPDNKEFTQKFARDLRNKNEQLLKIINPEAVTWEHTAANKQFEEEVNLEQQNVAMATGQSPAQQFSLIAPPPPVISQTGQPAPETEVPQDPAQAQPQTEPAPIQSEPTVSQPSFQAPGLPASFVNTSKNVGSNAQIFTKKNLGRLGNGLKNMFGNAANLGGRAGLGAINHGGNFLSNLSNSRLGLSNSLGQARSNLLSKGGGKKAALIFAGVFFLIFFMGAVGGLPGTTPTDEASPSLPGAGASDITSCKFTRGQENPKEASFKSNQLLSYIQEASQKSNIPPVVLAAFIRVESPSSSNKSDAEIANYSATCAQSSTGALGIMQIQPPGTTSAKGDPASCDDCIDAGAKLVGKNVSTLTTADYCDPRTSIIVGAGWILKKMSKLGYGDGTKWDPAWTNNKTAIEALVNTYYGCLQYGGATDCTGPYNYADDVLTSIQNCQATGSAIGVSGCPAVGKISTPYGFNIPGYPEGVKNDDCGNLLLCHNGIDIAAPEGTQVKSPMEGDITIVGQSNARGRYIEIDNKTSDLAVTLEHLQTVTVKLGDHVSRNFPVGTMGSGGEGVTGSHVHYKITKPIIGGAPINPLPTLGSALTDQDPALKLSDQISQNDYGLVKPSSGSNDNWGKCSQ